MDKPRKLVAAALTLTILSGMAAATSLSGVDFNSSAVEEDGMENLTHKLEKRIRNTKEEKDRSLEKRIERRLKQKTEQIKKRSTGKTKASTQHEKSEGFLSSIFSAFFG